MLFKWFLYGYCQQTHAVITEKHNVGYWFFHSVLQILTVDVTNPSSLCLRNQTDSREDDNEDDV